jgi:hypothetical protein
MDHAVWCCGGWVISSTAASYFLELILCDCMCVYVTVCDSGD